MTDVKMTMQIHRNYENFKKAFEVLKVNLDEDVVVDKKELTELQKVLCLDKKQVLGN